MQRIVVGKSHAIWPEQTADYTITKRCCAHMATLLLHERVLRAIDGAREDGIVIDCFRNGRV